jgi:hypothetical protein
MRRRGAIAAVLVASGAVAAVRVNQFVTGQTGG